MKETSITELPLTVLIPWVLGIFFCIMTFCWVACDMLGPDEPQPRIYYKEKSDA
jgi:hypothetical protein